MEAFKTLFTVLAPSLQLPEQGTGPSRKAAVCACSVITGEDLGSHTLAFDCSFLALFWENFEIANSLSQGSSCSSSYILLLISVPGQAAWGIAVSGVVGQ